ncbi:major facilitator transporter [Caballeronia udeis]|uniref:Major facilitator transporter n=1 Tax=Caballeronia udeis TaxID=1232866 RepID=A0A158H440_9BURK|nr:hypothetical protein [Caballeronia udeis]SAL39098.1 major facilitator transporter [Caballeronia udeis]
MKSRYRWVVAALLFFAGVLNYLDRAALSVVAPIIDRSRGRQMPLADGMDRLMAVPGKHWDNSGRR